MKVLVVAGGTGGHFYPGLAVAKELVRNGAVVHFIVRHGDAVIPLVEKDGFSYSTIAAGGFKRRLSLQNVVTLLKLSVGLMQSFFILFRNKPDVVLVMGGYLSIPPAFVAVLAGIPVILHEQNVKPGLANRLLGRWAKTVAIAFDDSRPYFSGRAVVTGNPVRPEFSSLPDQSQARGRFSLNPSKKTLLVFGGSLGAQRLNELVVEALGQMKDFANTWQVIHVSGPKDEERMRAAYKSLPFGHHVSGYCHDMAAAYAAADLVLCRAGASTVSELSVLEKPALLVPYPYASENHQWANALVLTEQEAAVAYDEKDLGKGKLAEILKDLMKEDALRASMRSSFHQMGETHRHAAAACAALVLKNA